jgi:hypothetical protein
VLDWGDAVYCVLCKRRFLVVRLPHNIGPYPTCTTCPSCRHGATFLGDPSLSSHYPEGALVIFGGSTDIHLVDSSALLNDVWLFDLSTRMWEQLFPRGTAPEPRQGVSMTTNGATVSTTCNHPDHRDHFGLNITKSYL